MQPRIDEVKYLAERSLDVLEKEVTEYLRKEDQHWELFGDVKSKDGEYIQTLIHIEFPEALNQESSSILG